MIQDINSAGMVSTFEKKTNTIVHLKIILMKIHIFVFRYIAVNQNMIQFFDMKHKEHLNFLKCQSGNDVGDSV